MKICKEDNFLKRLTMIITNVEQNQIHNNWNIQDFKTVEITETIKIVML